MKNPSPPALRGPLKAISSRHPLATLLTVTALLGTAHAVTWVGGTSNAWNTAANWSPAAVPSGALATINTTPANVARISVTPTATPTDITIGSGVTGNGRLDHTGGTASTGTSNNLFVGTSSGIGRYHLANVAVPGAGISGSGLGSGSMNARSRLYVGGNLAGSNAANGIVYINTTGTLAVTSLFEVGTAGATGVINLEAGTVTGNDWVYFGDGIAGSGTLNMTGGAFTKTGNNQFVIANNGSTGTANLSGGTVTVNNEIWVGQGAGSNGTVNLSGTAVINANNNVAIGRTTGTGTVTMTGGTWNKTGVGSFVIGGNGPGSMTHSGGLVNVQVGATYIGEQGGATTAALTLSGTAEFRTPAFFVGSSSPDATLNLNGGTVKTGQFSGGSGTETVNFNGTQIIATAVASENAANFIDGFDVAAIGTDGLKIDSNGFNLAAPQDLSGTGGVVKTGSGTFSLTGVNTHSGPNTVSAGKLVSNTSATGSGDFNVADGAGMGVIQQNVNDSLVVANVTLGSSGATTLDIDLGSSAGNTTVAPLNVTGTLALNGQVTVNIADGLPALGPIPLVTYVAPKAGGGSFVLGTLPAGVVDAVLTDDGLGLVSLEIIEISRPVWNGTIDGVWDTVTANWIEGLTDTTYGDPAPVLFNDDATGTTTITLDIPVAPYSVVFNNQTDAYSITGTGKIGGSGGLLKQGLAALTLGTLNDYTGPTTLEGGTVTINSLANGGSPSSIGASPSAAANLVLNSAILEYTGGAASTNRGFTVAGFDSGIRNANDLSFSGPVVSTGGTLVKSGAGNLTFSHPGANVFGVAGQGLKVQAGTVTLTGSAQTNTVGGELYVADTPDVPANLVLNNTSLTTTNWLAIGRGNGDAGVCNLTATNSTIATVNFSTGYNNGLANNASEQFVSLTNTVWTNNGNTFIAESAGSTTTMTLNGTSQFNINNNFRIAMAGTSNGTFTLNNSSSVTKTGGYFSVGDNGTGVMNVNGSASFTAATGDFNVGDVGTSNGTLNITGSGTVSIINAYIGKNGGTTGAFNQSGGSFSSGTFITIGRSNSAVGTANISGGTFTATTQILVGEQGTGTLTVSGTGSVTASGNNLVLGNGASGNATLNLNGGTLTAKQVIEQGNATSALNFNGGVLRAGTSANSNFLSGLNTATILAGGAFINTNGNNVTVSQVLTGAGGFTKQGAGTLTLSGANNYSGNTTVSTGTLSLSNAFLADTSTVTIANGAILNLPHGATDVVSGLVIGVAPPLVAGTYDSTTHPGVITGSGKIQVGGAVSAYDTWAASFGLNPLTDGAPAFDKDKDGEPNSIEFALGGSPISGSSRARTFPIIADGSVDGDTLKEQLITIAVRSGTPVFSGSPSPSALKDGYTYTIQGGTALTSFPAVVTPVATVVPPAPNATPPAGYEYRTFSLGGSNGTPGKGFLRVNVTP